MPRFELLLTFGYSRRCGKRRFVGTALRAATYPDPNVKDALYCFVGTALRVVTCPFRTARFSPASFAGTALRVATHPLPASLIENLSFAGTALRAVTCLESPSSAPYVSFAGTALRVVTHLLLLLMTLILCFAGTAHRVATHQVRRPLAVGYGFTGTALRAVTCRETVSKTPSCASQDRASSINLLGYGTSDTAIVLHRSCTSSGYSLFRVSLAKQFAWFVKPLERTAPVIISNNQVELYGLGLNYETCPRAIAL